MNIKKIYTENGKVIKEYFVHKEDAKEVALKLGITDDLVETLEEILATDEFTVIENSNGFYLSKDGKAVGFDIVAWYLNSEKFNSKHIVVGEVDTQKVSHSKIDTSKYGKAEETDIDLDEK